VAGDVPWSPTQGTCTARAAVEGDQLRGRTRSTLARRRGPERASTRQRGRRGEAGPSKDHLRRLSRLPGGTVAGAAAPGRREVFWLPDRPTCDSFPMAPTRSQQWICRVRPRSQLRDSAGFAPASLARTRALVAARMRPVKTRCRSIGARAMRRTGAVDDRATAVAGVSVACRTGRIRASNQAES